MNIKTAFVVAAAFGAIAQLTLATAAQAQSCSVQCLTAQGKKVGKKMSLNSGNGNGNGCILVGKKTVKKDCGGNGQVNYGLCYGTLIGNKTVKSKMTGC